MASFVAAKPVLTLAEEAGTGTLPGVTRATLHIVCGPPAGGKTVYGQSLARRLGAAFLDSDTATERVVRAGLRAAGRSPHDRDSPGYKDLYREPVYETLFALAEENLSHVPVVLAGPFTAQSQDPEWPVQLEARFGGAVKIHFVWADPETRRRRMISRGEPRDEPKLADWEAYLATCAPGPPPFPHVWIGSDGEAG